MQNQLHRKTLLLFINDYLEALVAHDHSKLPVSDKLKYTENGNPAVLGDGIWQTARTVALRKSFADPDSSQAGFWGAIEEKNREKILFALRLKVEDNTISEIETLLSRKGCHPIFSPDTVTLKPSWDAIIPRSERLSREVLIQVADSYFEGIEKTDGAVTLFHPDCQRYENGMQTTNSPKLLKFSSPAGLYRMDYIKKVKERRYPIVDEKRGLVWGIVVFDVPGTKEKDDTLPEGSVQHSLRSQARCLLLYEIFKIEDGLIKEIEAFMTNAPPDATHGWSE